MLGYLPRSSTVFSLASQGTQNLFQMLLSNSEQLAKSNIMEESTLVWIWILFLVRLSVLLCKEENIMQSMLTHPQKYYLHTAVRAIPTTDPPSVWCTVSIICLYGVPFIPVYGNLSVLAVGLTPQHRLLQSGFCRRSLACHQGQGEAASSSRPSPLLSWSCLISSLAPDFSAEKLLQCCSKQGPTIYFCSHFCCLPVTNFFMLVNLKNGLAEAIREKQKHLVFYVKSLEMYHMIPKKSIIPGLFDGQSFPPVQHHILALIAFSLHFHPQIPFLLLSPPCPQSRPWVHSSLNNIRKTSWLPGYPRLPWKTNALGQLSVIQKYNEGLHRNSFKIDYLDSQRCSALVTNLFCLGKIWAK